MTLTFTVIAPTGAVIGTNLSAAIAAEEILTYDGREYEIRQEHDGDGYRLWSRDQGRPWQKTVVFSLADQRSAAEAEIFHAVLVADWPGHPDAMTDDAYNAIDNDDA